MYSSIEEAIAFMVKANKGLKEKSDNMDKCFHVMIVYTMIRDITTTDDIVVAALLHNIINDTEYGYEEIEERFGSLVADIVSDLSEDRAIAKWLERKKEFVRRMRNNVDINVVNIMLATKLQELLSYCQSFFKIGDKIWKNTGGNKDENRWLYREIYNIAKKKGANDKLLNRYKELLKVYFGDLDE